MVGSTIHSPCIQIFPFYYLIFIFSCENEMKENSKGGRMRASSKGVKDHCIEMHFSSLYTVYN